MADRALRLGQVAERAGVSRQTVARWIAAGVLQAIALPSGRGSDVPIVRVRESELERLLSGQTKKAKA